MITHSLFSCSRLNNDQAFQTFTLDSKGKTLSCPFEIDMLVGDIAVICPLFMFFVAFLFVYTSFGSWAEKRIKNRRIKPKAKNLISNSVWSEKVRARKAVTGMYLSTDHPSHAPLTQPLSYSLPPLLPHAPIPFLFDHIASIPSSLLPPPPSFPLFCRRGSPSVHPITLFKQGPEVHLTVLPRK